MGNKLETLFDILPKMQAAVLDSTQLEDICRQQQALTMRRVAYWLQGHAKLRFANGESAMSSQMKTLAEELDYLSDLPLTLFSERELKEWVS